MKWIGCLLFTMAVSVSAEEIAAPQDLAETQKPVATKSVEQESMELLEQDFEKPDQKNTTEAAVKPVKKVSDKESDIPVLAKAAPVKAESSNPFYRMMIAMMMTIALGIGVIVYAKRFKKTALTKGPSPKIQVLTQHYLGPKKSLAIIRIAGESILIGITDHNITPIKVLSLLDEDIPEQTPNNFDTTMQHLDFIDDVQDQFKFSNHGRFG